MSSSSSDGDMEILALILYRRRKRRRIWVHDINRKRKDLGEYHRLVSELCLYGEKFKEYFMLSREQFRDLLELVGPNLERQQTNWREPIGPRQRLAICLRYLASGDSFKSIAFSYRMGKSTVTQIVPEVCDVIWRRLQPDFMPVPDADVWKSVASQFENRWNFPNCIGSLDGKHVVIQAPPNSGSLFYNYKGTFSIVLLALVDADYKFIAVDVGAYGRNSDGGIYASSPLGQMLDANTLNVPEPKALPGAPHLGAVPYVIVADEAFPLKTYNMMPYPGRHLSEERKVFNYRLSRARRIVENAFGILSNKWQIYQRRIRLDADNATRVVKATCVLHNFWRSTLPEDAHREGDDIYDHGQGNLQGLLQFTSW